MKLKDSPSQNDKGTKLFVENAIILLKLLSLTIAESNVIVQNEHDKYRRLIYIQNYAIYNLKKNTNLRRNISHKSMSLSKRDLKILHLRFLELCIVNEKAKTIISHFIYFYSLVKF